jgi:hypothetical protein
MMKRLALFAFACAWLVACERPPSAPTPQFDLDAVRPSPGGWASSSDLGTAQEPRPLTRFKSLTLPTVGGDIDAVLYDGNTLLINATATTKLTGFTTPSTPPYTANTTYIVVDGQCGPESPNGCVSTTPTAGSGDRLTFQGQGSPIAFRDGPDAFKGTDRCPWGPLDTCLWDNRTFDVSAFLAPGDQSATVTVTSAPFLGGTDCINHEAQVFAVGPTPAWAFGGYTSDWRGLRNQGSGELTIAKIPPTATVVQADLYWNILNPRNPGGAMMVNGVPVKGEMYQQGGDPCWDGGSWAFRADVTHLVPGNGVYVLSGYPTGSVTGQSPWIFSPTPMMEGASLVVFYAQVSTPGKVTLGGWIDPATGALIDGSTVNIQQGPSAGNKATFGGVVKFQAGEASPDGNFRYIDHGPIAEDIKATSFSLLVISDGPCGPNTHAAYRFTGTENGVPGQEFKVEVDDCGEPGSDTSSPDMFFIQKLPAGYMAAGPLVGGNVQIHR